MQPELSLIIPAYNESQRLPGYLACLRHYLDLVFAGNYEVIVVDDGSRDGLEEKLSPIANHWPQLALLRHPINQGKGAAVRTGMLSARGRLLLFTDADGATPLEEEKKLRLAIARGADIAVGSRLLPDSRARRVRPWSRHFFGRIFAWLVHELFALPIADTQCGFKMFRRKAARQVFQLCREPGYLFDIEVLIRARNLGWRVAEIPVSWSEMPGSKVNLVRDGWNMLTGLWKLRRSLREHLQPGSGGISVSPGLLPPCRTEKQKVTFSSSGEIFELETPQLASAS